MKGGGGQATDLNIHISVVVQSTNKIHKELQYTEDTVKKKEREKYLRLMFQDAQIKTTEKQFKLYIFSYNECTFLRNVVLNVRKVSFIFHLGMPSCSVSFSSFLVHFLHRFNVVCWPKL